MKRIATLLLPALMVAGCNAHGGEKEGGGPSGQAGRKDFPVGAFDRIELAGSPDVVVAVGAGPAVVAEGDTGLIERLDVRVEDGILKIGHKKGSWSFGWSKDKSPLRIHVTAPALRGASLTGSGDMRIDKVQADNFAAAMTGSGDMDIGQLRARTAAFAVTGSGDIRAAGAAESASYSVTGSGAVHAAGLEVKRASVKVMGSGNVDARASETADVSVMGSGDAVVSGTAKCSVNKAGSGDARCGGA